MLDNNQALTVNSYSAIHILPVRDTLYSPEIYHCHSFTDNCSLLARKRINLYL